MVFCCGFRYSVPDVVETLLPLLSSSRTRREVVSHMVSMGLVDSVKDLKKEKYDFIVISVILKVKTSSRVETFCSVYNPNFWLLCKLFFFFFPSRMIRKGTRIVLWTEEQEQELQMLFEDFRDSDG